MCATIWVRAKFGKFEKIKRMQLEELKEKIISEINISEEKDVLEEVLLILNKKKQGEIVDIMKWKEKILSEDDNLLKRLS